MSKFSLRDENGKFYYGWWIVLIAGVVCGLVYSGCVSITGVFLLPVTGDMGFQPGNFSLYLTILSITGIITLLVVPRFFNEKNMKPLMLIAAIAGIISFIGFALARSLAWFYIFSIPQGFCFASFTMTPCQILVSNWFGEKVRGRAMSIFLLIMSLVTVVLMNALNYVVLNVSWRTGYAVLAGCVALCIILALLVFKWSPESKGIKRMGDLDEEEMAAMGSHEIQGLSIKEGLKKPGIWFAFISCALTVIASSSILQYGIATMVGAGQSQTGATLIVSALSLIMLVTGPIVGVVCDKCRLSISAAGTGILFAVSTLGLAIMGSGYAGMIMFVGGYIFGATAVNIITPLMMNFMCGEKNLTRFISYANVFISIGGAIGASAMGFMLQFYGSFRIPWIYMTIILLLVALIRGIVTSKKRKFVPKEEAAPAEAAAETPEA